MQYCVEPNPKDENEYNEHFVCASVGLLFEEDESEDEEHSDNVDGER